MKKVQFSQVKAVRGMNDILPSDTPLWQIVEKTILQIFQQYAYQEIRLPMLERTELFHRGIGEVTDIVEKEMYTFLDRNQESLTLRPEGTASCVRAAIEHGLLYHQTQKLWYFGPMFRYERPQKGRYRQFYHIGAETFGFTHYLIEAELILMVTRCFAALQLSDKMTLQLNSLGSTASRMQFREKFVAFCEQHIGQLDEDSQRRLKTNPLRILDSKNPVVKELLQEAPQLSDYLDEASQQAFQQLCNLLSELKIHYEVNPHLVRGLDYYTGTVFEWVTPHLGAQSTVCAGGRYDNLVEELGGVSTPACGFAIGMERLVELYAESHAASVPHMIDAYVIADEKAIETAVRITESIRNAVENIKLQIDYVGGSFKSQFKRADKSQARFVLILGEDELVQNMITFKDLRRKDVQLMLSLPDLIQHLKHILRSLS